MTIHNILFLSLFAFISVGLPACSGESGPDSTETTSAQFKSLAEKVAFLEKYVLFRREYEELEFSIYFHNNGGGMVPGPNDWDIQIIAKVPARELQDWTQNIAKTSTPDSGWLETVPTGIDYGGVFMWYQDDYRLIGVDEANCIIVYRNTTHQYNNPNPGF